jgi:hypothetical protein
MSRTFATPWSARCLSFGVCLVGVCLVAASATSASAATIKVTAPAGCVEASSIGEQVDGLIGRPVGSVEGVDFEVTISDRPAPQPWRLRLDTLGSASHDRRTRELTASTCAELADAAAVAIAVSIASLDDGAATAPARAEPTPGPVVSARPTATPPPTQVGLQVLAVGEVGAVPATTLGLAVGGFIQIGSLRLVADGALFAPRRALLSDGTGGEFQLAVLGGLGCATGGLGRVLVLGCGGAEVGRLSGDGLGVRNPSSRAELWLAGRAEAGANFSIGPRAALALRVGAALPVFRPTFLLDATTVYRPSAVTGRATAGVELTF